MAGKISYQGEEEEKDSGPGLLSSNTTIDQQFHPFKLTQPIEKQEESFKFKQHAPQSQVSLQMLKRRVEKNYQKHANYIAQQIKELEEKLVYAQDFQQQALITFQKESYGILSNFYELKMEFISYLDFDLTKLLENVTQNLEYMGLSSDNKLIINLASIPNSIRGNFAIFHYISTALSIIGLRYACRQVVNLRISMENNEMNAKTQFLQLMLNFRSKSLSQKLLTELLKHRVAQETFENFQSLISKNQGLCAFTTAMNLCYGQILKALSIKHQSLYEVQIKISIECPLSKLANSFNKPVKFYVNQSQVPVEKPEEESLSSADEQESKSDEELQTGISSLAQMNLPKKLMKQVKTKEEHGEEEEGGSLFSEQHKALKFANLEDIEF